MVEDEDGSPVAGLSFTLFDEEDNTMLDRPRKAAKGKAKPVNPSPMTPLPVNALVLDEKTPIEAFGTEVEGESGDSSQAKGNGKGKSKASMASVGKKQHDLLAKAKDLFAKTKISMSDDQIWNSNIRQRQVDAAVKALSTAENGLLSFVATFPPAEECSRNIQAFCDNLQLRFGVLKNLKSTPFHFETKENLDDATFQILMNMEVSMLNTLVTHVATIALKHIDQDWVQMCSHPR